MLVRVRGHTGGMSAAQEGAMAGRAGRRLNNNVEATFQGFAGADYDLQARCSGVLVPVGLPACLNFARLKPPPPAPAGRFDGGHGHFTGHQRWVPPSGQTWLRGKWDYRRRTGHDCILLVAELGGETYYDYVIGKTSYVYTNAAAYIF